jgi:hypothetical protein
MDGTAAANQTGHRTGAIRNMAKEKGQHSESGAVFTVPVRDSYAGGTCESSHNPQAFLDCMSGAAQPQLTLPAFQAALQSEFQFEVTAQLYVPLVLVETRARQSPTGEASGDSFALLFHGPAAQPLAQRMYPCTHPAFGSFDLFIVPVGRDQNSFHYEAVFNLQPQKQ